MSKRLLAYCDASFDRRSQAAGLGIYAPQDNIEISQSAAGMMDCNHSEVMALHLLLESLLKAKGEAECANTSLVVICDSDHAVDLYYGRRKVKSGREQEASLLRALLVNSEKFFDVVIFVVKSHKGRSPHSMGNEHADKLAKRAMRQMRDYCLRSC
jgi:ribonuclease HI